MRTNQQRSAHGPMPNRTHAPDMQACAQARDAAAPMCPGVHTEPPPRAMRVNASCGSPPFVQFSTRPSAAVSVLIDCALGICCMPGERLRACEFPLAASRPLEYLQCSRRSPALRTRSSVPAVAPCCIRGHLCAMLYDVHARVVRIRMGADPCPKCMRRTHARSEQAVREQSSRLLCAAGRVAPSRR